MNAKPFSKLLEPVTFGHLALRNRVVMAPMATNYADDGGLISDQLLRYYVERARGGVGLIIVEGTCISYPEGKGWANELAIDREGLVSGHYRLVEAVHTHGAKIALQIHHAGRQTNFRLTDGHQPVAPSAIARQDSAQAPRELTREELSLLARKFGEAAERAQRAGYDAVEIHSAHGYLLHQFLAERTNRRQDEYGGSLENRLRFSREVIAEVRRRVGPGFPILYRFSAEGGYSLEEALVFAREWEKAGVDMLHVSVGGIGPLQIGATYPDPMSRPQGWIVPYATAVKRVVKIPVITVGEIREPAFANQVLAEGKADLIALGRPFLADPEWVKKATEGRPEDIRRCISCVFCEEGIQRSTGVHCLVNPELGRESEMAEIKPAPAKKRVMIVGSGPAGMEAARVAAQRGHQVSLYEKAPVLGGGQLALAAAPPHKEKIHWFREYLTTQVNKLPITVHLNTSVDKAVIEKESPEVLLLATGARPLIPQISGIQHPKVLTAYDVLSGQRMPEGKKVAVLGGRQTGCETAEFLAERGYSVTIVSRSPASSLAEEAPHVIRGALLARLRRRQVEVVTEQEVKEICPEGLRLVDRSGQEQFLEAEAVVLARGVTAAAELAEQVADLVPEIHLIGDSAEPRNIAAAVYEGALVARRV